MLSSIQLLVLACADVWRDLDPSARVILDFRQVISLGTSR
jgi:hypothetical protein